MVEFYFFVKTLLRYILTKFGAHPSVGHLVTLSLIKSSSLGLVVISFLHRTPTQAARLAVCSKCKEMCERILKSRNIVNLYRGMTQLKLKINENLLH